MPGARGQWIRQVWPPENCFRLEILIRKVTGKVTLKDWKREFLGIIMLQDTQVFKTGFDGRSPEGLLRLCSMQSVFLSMCMLDEFSDQVL